MIRLHQRFSRGVVLAVFCLVSALPAAGAETTLRVATRVLPPMVIQQGDSLTGFSIDLWNAIGERLHVTTQFRPAPDVQALLDDVAAGGADVGIAAISITSGRDEKFDFSQPILNSGLQILVPGGGATPETNPLGQLMALLMSRTILVWLGAAFVLVLVPAHLVWVLERLHPEGILHTRRYFPGIFQAMFWAASTLATQGEQMPRQWLARIVAVLWMFTSVVFVAFYTAQLAANLTVQQIQGGISGPEDLKGKRVATTEGGTAVAVLRDLQADVVEVTRVEDAYAALDAHQVQAVVLDSPVLLYYSATQGKGRVHLVGTPFRNEDYGIVVAPDSPLRKRIDRALLSLREDGSYQRIHDKWFAVP